MKINISNVETMIVTTLTPLIWHASANPAHPSFHFTSLGVCWRDELIAESRNIFLGSDLENPSPVGPIQHLMVAREDSCPKDSDS